MTEKKASGKFSKKLDELYENSPIFRYSVVYIAGLVIFFIGFLEFDLCYPLNIDCSSLPDYFLLKSTFVFVTFLYVLYWFIGNSIVRALFWFLFTFALALLILVYYVGGVWFGILFKAKIITHVLLVISFLIAVIVAVFTYQMDEDEFKEASAE